MSRQKANRDLCVPKGVEGHRNDESSARGRSSTPRQLDKRTANSQLEDRALLPQTACGAFCHRYLQVLRRTYLRHLNYLPCRRCNLLEPSTDHSDYVRLRQIATCNPRPYPNRDLGLRPVSCKRNPQAQKDQLQHEKFFSQSAALCHHLHHRALNACQAFINLRVRNIERRSKAQNIVVPRCEKHNVMTMPGFHEVAGFVVVFRGEFAT
jgi:hypothetical protein